MDISPLNITQGYEVYTDNVPANQTFFIYVYLCKNTEKKHVKVALSDSGSMKFSHFIEHSPCDWETTMRQNVVLTIFYTQNIHHHAWKTARTTLQCIIGLQSRGKGHEMEKNCGTNLSHSFQTFALGLDNNKTSKCKSCPRMVT